MIPGRLFVITSRLRNDIICCMFDDLLSLNLNWLIDQISHLFYSTFFHHAFDFII